MSLFQVTKKQVIENYELRTMTGDIVSFTPSYSQLLPDPFSDLNVTVNVVATGGNGTPDNPNPINGYTEAKITRCGVNVWNEEWELGTIDIYTGQDVPGTSNIRSKGYIPCKPNTTYLFNRGSFAGNVFEYDGNKSFVQLDAGATTFTTTANTHYIRFYMGGAYGTTYNNDISINYPATDTTYHAYTGNTYTVSFGQTVYGGVLDVTRGKLTVTFKKVHLTSSLSYMYGGSAGNIWYSDNDAYQPTTTSESGLVISSHFKAVTQSAMGSNDNCLCKTQNNAVIWIKDTTEGWTDVATFKTWLDTQDANNNPVEIAFKLATPFDIDLTPEVISAIVGTNNVFADCGNVTVTCLI